MIICIGNALVDSLQTIEEDVIEKLSLNKARMTLVDKERSNFCDYFHVSEKDHKGLQNNSSVSKEKIKATFDQLFDE